MLRPSDYELMSTFELIDRINCADSWIDEDVDLVLRELWDRYGVAEKEYDDIEDYDTVWYLICGNVYDNIEIQHYFSINEKEYCIISIPTDETCEYAVTDIPCEHSGFEVYSIGTMRECKNYIKELIDNA